MTSPFAQLFIALQARLKAITINNAPAIAWIDQDLRQVESHNGDDRPPVAFPAATIDIAHTTFTQGSANNQYGEITVLIRLAFPPFTSSSSITPAPYRNAALYFYDLEQAIHTALHGWAPGITTIDDTTTPATTIDLSDTYGPLTRQATQTEMRNDRIRVRVLTYHISLNDTTTEQLPTPVTGITLNPTFTIQE